jgi:hypothetical protein
VHAGSVADVSAVHAASIFNVEVTRVGEFSCIYWPWIWLFIALVTCLPTYRTVARYFEFLSQFYGFRLTHPRTSRKVADSTPDKVIGFFSWANPSSRTTAMGSTQPLNRNEYQESSRGGGVLRLWDGGLPHFLDSQVTDGGEVSLT